MSEKPIIFSGEMVRAILGGRKSMTRRVVKPQPTTNPDFGLTVFPQKGQRTGDGLIWPNAKNEILKRCPYGQPGDRLWVRENWLAEPCFDETKPRDIPSTARVSHAATDCACGGKLRPSIHMPRWASRITLEITGIRVERVQDISEADSTSEGVTHYPCGHPDCVGPDGTEGMHYGPRAAFRRLWESINAKRGYGWDVNPWVWVIEFRRIEP